MSKLDLPKIERLLEELHACDEKIADRGPFPVLPRDLPDVPRLKARMAEIHGELDVRRKNVLVAKGHDMDWNGAEFVAPVIPVAGQLWMLALSGTQILGARFRS